MRILSFLVIGMFTKQLVTLKKLIIFAFVNLQQVKEIIENGHVKLNRHMTAQKS